MILIRQGHIIDPANKFEGQADILIDGAKIVRIGKNLKSDTAKTIDAKGKIIAPGLIDMHAHLRQPGREDEETFETGANAAAKGGFTTICAMPNTEPCCDTSGGVEYILSEARKAACVNILPIGAITVGRKGEDMAEMADMKNAGIVAVSDDGASIKNSQLMRKALEYARMLGLVVIAHCEDTDLVGDGMMNESFNSTLLGIKPIPNAAEAIIVARDILLAELAKARIHIAHVSTKESVSLIKDAKARGVNITAETCPHYFTLTDDAVRTFNTNFKVNPPLRSAEDLKAIIMALKDGTIDIIATDHAPHNEAEKDVEFDFAPCGIIEFETALCLGLEELVDKKVITLSALIYKMSTVPAEILGLKDKGSLKEGSDADIIIFDPNAEWVLKKEEIVSKSKNSPFIGRTLKGKVICTICAGKVVFAAGEPASGGYRL